MTAVAYSRTFFMHVQNLPGEMVSLRIVGVEEGLSHMSRVTPRTDNKGILEFHIFECKNSYYLIFKTWLY